PLPGRAGPAVLFLLLYAKSGLRWLVRKSGWLRLLPRRLQQMESLPPEVSWHHLTASLPERTAAAGPARATVGLVAGCVQRVFFPAVNEATVRVLAAEGCEVRVPAGQGRCGAPSMHSRRREESHRVAS